MSGDVTVRIPKSLAEFVRNSVWFKLYDDLDNLVADTIARQVGMSRKPKFYRGRKFSIPKSCFILFGLPKHEYDKLCRWIKKGDQVTVNTVSHGEVVIMNEGRLDRWRVRKNREKVMGVKP